jgi:hypothetical protein
MYNAYKSIVWDEEKLSELRKFTTLMFAKKYNLPHHHVIRKRREIITRKKIRRELTPELIEEMNQSTRQQLKLKYQFSDVQLNRAKIEFGVVYKTQKSDPTIMTLPAEAGSRNTQESQSFEDVVNLKFAELNIDHKTVNSLLVNDIRTIGDLLKYSRKTFLLLPNIGRKTLATLETLLEKYGVNF